MGTNEIPVLGWDLDPTWEPQPMEKLSLVGSALVLENDTLASMPIDRLDPETHRICVFHHDEGRFRRSKYNFFKNVEFVTVVDWTGNCDREVDYLIVIADIAQRGEIALCDNDGYCIRIGIENGEVEVEFSQEVIATYSVNGLIVGPGDKVHKTADTYIFGGKATFDDEPLVLSLPTERDFKNPRHFWIVRLVDCNSWQEYHLEACGSAELLCLGDESRGEAGYFIATIGKGGPGWIRASGDADTYDIGLTLSQPYVQHT